MAIFTAIGTAVAGALAFKVGTFAFAATVGIVQAIGGIGLNLLASEIAGKPKRAPFAIQGTLQSGGDVPRSMIMGWRVTAGSLAYANTWGEVRKAPNGHLTQVICLADLPVAGLSRVWVNGEPCTLDLENLDANRGYPVTEYRQGSRDHLWIKFHDGTQTTADPFLVSTVSSGDRPWQATRVGVGCPYAIATAAINEELFTGFPSFRFEVIGTKLYDISKDDTVGGEGSHRWGEPSTWGGDGDHLPAVQEYNLLRGISFNGQWFYGLQAMTAARLPAGSWIDAIGKCRQPVDGADGPEPQYRSGIEIHVSAPIVDAITALNTACLGRLAEIGGAYEMHVGAPAEPSFAIDDSVIISTEEQSFTPFYGLADSINGIAGRYPSPAEGWSAKVAPPLYRADLEARDGNRRLMADVTFDAVPYDEQVQRLMSAALEEGQRARRHTFTLPPEFWPHAVPNAVFQWTSARNGYETKLFRIDGSVDKANLDLLVDVTEVDPADYDWDHASDYLPPVDGPVGPIRPGPQEVVDWFAEPWVLTDSESKARRPAIRLTWDGDQQDVDFIRFEVRLTATGEVIYRGSTAEVAAGAIVISQNLLPDEAYGVRGRYYAISARPTEWTDWLPVTTPDLRLGPDDIYLPGVIDEIIEIVDDNYSFIGRDLRDVIDEVRRMALKVIDQDYANFNDKKQLRTELVSTTENITAKYTALVTAATGPGSAIVQRLESLEATVPGLATASALNALTLVVEAQGSTISAQGAAITAIELELPNKASVSAVTTLSGRVDTVEGVTSAQANAITSLSAASTSGNVATANQRFAVSAGPTGYAARLSWEARAGGSGTYRSASIFIDVPTSTGAPTRVVVVGDQFVVTDGTNISRPMVFQGGVLTTDQLRVNGAHIMDLTVGINQIAVNAVTVPYFITTATEPSQSGTNLDFTVMGPSVPFASTDVGISGSIMLPVIAGGSVTSRTFSLNVYAVQGANEYRVGLFWQIAPNAASGTYYLGCALAFVPPAAGTYQFRAEINVTSGASRTYSIDPGTFSVLRHRR